MKQILSRGNFQLTEDAQHMSLKNNKKISKMLPF
jgi:hypothetical protein